MPVDKQVPECKICRLALPESYRIYENDRWRVRHSFETDIPGYCLLEPCRHFLDLSEADSRELADFGTILSAVMKAQRAKLSCRRVYTFSLAEAVSHFHVHIIPIDKNFFPAYKGRGIMSYPVDPGCDPELVAMTVSVLQSAVRSILMRSLD